MHLVYLDILTMTLRKIWLSGQDRSPRRLNDHCEGLNLGISVSNHFLLPYTERELKNEWDIVRFDQDRRQ